MQNGYGFGFFVDEGEKGTVKKFDERIGDTIIDIAFDFISSQPDNTFLLYHCESNDGKQVHRHKLFDRWFNKCPHQDKICKQGLEVKINTDYGDIVNHYVGFITQAKNKDIDKATTELEQFSVDIVNENVNKNQ